MEPLFSLVLLFDIDMFYLLPGPDDVHVEYLMLYDIENTGKVGECSFVIITFRK